MKTTKQAKIVLFFVLYLLMFNFSNFSLNGFWTDIVFSIMLSIFALFNVYKNKNDKYWFALRTIIIICSLWVFGVIGKIIINPFAWNTFKIRSFYFQYVDGRLFNAYFIPVGANSGGEGIFWITEIPLLFPFIEKEVYSDSAVLHNFKVDVLEGQPIDNYEIVKHFIKERVIKKKR